MTKVFQILNVEFQCEKRIIIEKRNIDEFNGQIDALRDRIRSIKSTMGGINHAIETSTMADKQVQILENRLEKVRFYIISSLCLDSTKHFHIIEI